MDKQKLINTMRQLRNSEINKNKKEKNELFFFTLKPNKGGREQLVVNFRSLPFCSSVNSSTHLQNASINGCLSLYGAKETLNFVKRSKFK